MKQRLDISTKWAPIIGTLAPPFKVIQCGQGVYARINGKFKDSLRDIPHKTFPTNAILFPEEVEN